MGLVIIYMISFLFSFDYSPSLGASLNYTSVFFKWPQISNKQSYKIYINSASNDERIYSSDSNAIIIRGLNWDKDYFWRVCGLDENDSEVECYENLYFSIKSIPANFPDINILFNSENLNYLNGITILDFESIGISAGLDISGNAIWFVTPDSFPTNKIIITQVLDNGNFLGFANGVGYEFDIDGQIVFQTPQSIGVHHQIHKAGETYFVLDQDRRQCPDNCPSDLPDVDYWKGDNFVELDFDGNVVWELSTFDFLGSNEYNPFWIDFIINQGYDWTHSNSIFFESGVVYVSMRNLSRISAIDYDTKEVIWHIGDLDFMDSIFFNDGFGFSHQHSAQIIDNGNILFFDNGRNNNPEVSRCLEISFNESDAEIAWEHVLPSEMLTLSRGECDRLNNGNTLISAGASGTVLEVDSNNDFVWKLLAKSNDNPTRIYRSQRIPGLFSNAFSYEVDNMIKEDGSYYFSKDSLILNSYNLGYLNQKYCYRFYNSNDALVLDGDFEVGADSNTSLALDFIDFYLGDYRLDVYPLNNISKKQSLNFKKVDAGDVNLDELVNVSDIILIVTLILGNQYTYLADMDENRSVNVSDIVLVVNKILQ
tara:strand:+ start:1410 stop:3194 length:1785 start_codon:yes stop_codon:yes gene_type:complete